MKILILAHLDDIGAQRVAARLRACLGRTAIEIIPAQSLAMAPRIVYTLEGQGAGSGKSSSIAVQFAGGLELDAREYHTVFNRLHVCDAPQFSSAAQVDKDYANAELSALWVSWLFGLRSQGVRVVNPPLRGAFQPGYSRLEWLRLAALAGMPVKKVHFPASPANELPAQVRWLAIGEKILPLPLVLPGSENPWIETNGWLAGDDLLAPGISKENILRLQALSNCPLLEIILISNADGSRPELVLSQVNPFPALLEDSGVEAVATFLGDG